MEEKMYKNDFINKVEPGLLVAFKNNDKTIAAKVLSKHEEEIKDPEGNLQRVRKYVKVETKNGSIYFVDYENITWVKTGSRWPTGIYNALKEGRNR